MSRFHDLNLLTDEMSYEMSLMSIGMRESEEPPKKKRGRPKKVDPHPILPFMGRTKTIVDNTPTTDPVHSLLCYNMLCQKYARQHYFSHTDKLVLAWPKRKERLEKELESYDADIMCIQELDRYAEYWNGRMTKQGYSSVYKQRTRSKSDGCGIFFRHNKYQLVASKPVEFNNIARVGELYDELALTDNVAVMIILKVRTPGAPIARKESPPKIDVHVDNVQEQYLCIVNTHLFWNPSFPDIKAAQCHYLLSETKQFLSTQFGMSCEKCPILFCGDFNSMPDSDVYKLLTQGQVSIVRVNPLKKKLKTINQVSWYATHKVEDDEEDGENEVVVTPIDEETVHEKEFIEGYHEIATFTNPLDLTSGYALACGQEPAFTNYTASFNGTLDYIFLGKVKSETPAPLRVREALNVIDETAAKEFNGLPSPKFPSDHLALLLSVQILRN